MSLRFIDRPSPNFNERVGVVRPDILLLHYTGMQSCEAAVARLTDAAARVSSHYTIDEDGTVYVHVPEHLRAWHAGVSSWRGHNDINSRSIGIEIVNPGHEFGYRAFPEAQIEAVIALSQKIIARHEIPARNVIAHSDIAPGRKTDPGELFPWRRLAAVGVGVWVDGVPLEVETLSRGMSGPGVFALQSQLSRYGYGLEKSGEFDGKTECVVTEFQRHFRPGQLDGVADSQTQSLLHVLNEILDRTV